jgi:hypothetical protein
MNIRKLVAIYLLLCCSSIALAASPSSTTVVINPTSDGSIYTCSTCNHTVNHDYLAPAGYIQGIARFSTSEIHGPITQATFTVNPYALPLHDFTIDVYGIASGTATATYDDAFSGSPLGTMILPRNLGFGQDATFDVTAFLASAHVPFVGFNLRSDGSATFSSRSHNYGHPAQLHVTFVPEPSTIIFAMIGCTVLPTRRRKSVPHNRV